MGMLNKPVVAIIGAGFGGLNAAKNLHNVDAEILLIDKNNYHLFQPLLYQVATAALSSSDIAYPVRSVFRRQKNLEFLFAHVTRVNLRQCCLETSTGDIHYDYLILAPGSETNFFGLDKVAEFAFDLKDLDDAESIRNHLLRMFELSNRVEDDILCNAMRTIVIVGGGPTGVECAGAISELIRLVLNKDFPRMDFSDVHVIVVEAQPQLLPGFPTDLGEAAFRMLQNKHVEIRLNAAMADFDGKEVLLRNGETIPAYTLIWAAGVRARKIIDTLGVNQGKQGRVAVEPTLQIPGHPEAFVIGDAAYLEYKGESFPMMAPVAIQQARTVAENIRRMMLGKELIEFRYKDPGSLATIGRSAAVARVKNLKFSGFIAWVVWLVVHLVWLIGFRNRLLVLINWAWSYLFYESGVRLIIPGTENVPEVEGML